MAEKFLSIVFIIIIYVPAFSQNGWKSWGSGGINFHFNRRFDFRLNYLSSYNLSDRFKNTFSQPSASISYNVTNRLSVMGGAMITSFPSNTDPTYRYFTRASYKFPIKHFITWSNAVQAEQHSQSETRFRNRLIYITRLSNSRRLNFLHLSLSASYWLFYNMGGNKIRYFQKTGDVAVRNTPDGFHRARLYLTANSKVTDNFSLSIYYMRQQEFNLLTGPYRRMNVTNPSTGKVTRAFDNYNVAGISLLFNIDLNQNKKTQF